MTAPRHTDPRPPTATGDATLAPPGAGPVADNDAVPADLADHPRYRVTRLLGQGGMGAV
jgi:hypothetical protein